jgi:non-ribosomal peptide synthetase component F
MTNHPYHEHSILRHIAAITSQSPDTVAVEDRRQKLTYRELDDASSRFAARLQQHGVQRGQPVPVVSSLCIPFLVGILGVLKARAVYVPVDRSQWSEEHISGVLRAVNSGVLAVDSGEDRRWDGYGVVVAVDEEGNSEGSDTAEEVGEKKDEKQDEKKDGKRDEKQDEKQDAACIIFTSGTTGKPKGVIIRHEALANLVVTRRSDVCLGAGDRFLMILSPAFDGKFVILLILLILFIFVLLNLLFSVPDFYVVCAGILNTQPLQRIPAFFSFLNISPCYILCLCCFLTSGSPGQHATGTFSRSCAVEERWFSPLRAISRPDFVRAIS